MNEKLNQKPDLNLQWFRDEASAIKFMEQRIKPGMVVIDAGAYIGFFSQLAAYLMQGQGTICAFEPNNDTYNTLKQNLVNYPCVRTYPFAVDKEDGMRWFHKNYYPVGSCLIEEPQQVTEWDYLVRTVALDDLFDHVNFIKIDVEGAEFELLQGAQRLLKECKPDLILSLHWHQNIDIFSIVNLLKYCGYTLYDAFNTNYFQFDGNYYERTIQVFATAQ